MTQIEDRVPDTEIERLINTKHHHTSKSGQMKERERDREELRWEASSCSTLFREVEVMCFDKRLDVSGVE